MSRMGPEAEFNQQGHAEGFVVKYNTSTTVKISAGSYDSAGKIFELATDTIYTISTLAIGFNHYYIYLDKSASGSIAPVFYDESTEPVFSIAKNGWYHPTNTEDRIVGVMSSETTPVTLMKTATRARKNTVINEMGRLIFPWMAYLMDPDGFFQDPNITSGSVITPVNATRLRFLISNTNTDTNISLFVGINEMTPLGGVITNAQFQDGGFNRKFITAWINLGASRNVRLAGAANDDNFLSLQCVGYEYER